MRPDEVQHVRDVRAEVAVDEMVLPEADQVVGHDHAAPRRSLRDRVRLRQRIEGHEVVGITQANVAAPSRPTAVVARRAERPFVDLHRADLAEPGVVLAPEQPLGDRIGPVHHQDQLDVDALTAGVPTRFLERSQGPDDEPSFVVDVQDQGDVDHASTCGALTAWRRPHPARRPR